METKQQQTAAEPTLSRSPAAEPTPNPPKQQQQFVRFLFFKLDPAWHHLDAASQKAGKEAFATVVERYADRMYVQSYSTVGTRADTDLALVMASYRLEEFHDMQAELLSTTLGRLMTMPYSYLAMTRRSIYKSRHERPEGRENSRVIVRPGRAKYLFVYPFVKTRAWYRLPFAERQRLMSQHIELGQQYPTVIINTTYSFGLDDQEFVVSFDSDYPQDFLDLVMRMRETEASSYTLRDTPTFTCLTMEIRQALDAIGR